MISLTTHLILSQFRSFESESQIDRNIVKEKVTTYLLARDEDCENAFHSTADFVSTAKLIA